MERQRINPAGMNPGDKRPYKATITSDQFLFHEMRITARLMIGGMAENEIPKKIADENLFQYPTEKSIKRLASVCISRLNAMNSNTLVQAISEQPGRVAKQICLYAMMKQSRLVWDFMVTVIGEKYRLKNTNFGRIDMNSFFMRLQEQDDAVAAWSDSTVTKIKQVLTKVLVENEYLDNIRSSHLNPIYIQPVLENAIRSNGDEAALPAFNCFP
jgi:hypothetical protein